MIQIKIFNILLTLSREKKEKKKNPAKNTVLDLHIYMITESLADVLEYQVDCYKTQRVIHSCTCFCGKHILP